MRQERKDEIRAALAQAIHEGREDIVKLGVERFGVTRQAISKHLAAMVREGILEARGRTRGRVYSLRILAENNVRLDLAHRPAEDEVWRESFAPLLSGLPKNVFAICRHGFTEMFNNAVEHSEGNEVISSVSLDYVSVDIRVLDDGVGIFKKIKNGLNLSTEREAILELTKGKVTTDPMSHSGEGIFFTSRMFEKFSIFSDRLLFCHYALDDNWFSENEATVGGTFVIMQIPIRSPRNLRDVFDRYTSDTGSLPFDKTEVPVGLLCVGDQNVVSRSQAKRLLSGMDKFRVIRLDFKGVEDIGQAFADEVFRVFQNQNPSIILKFSRANRRVKGMIQRARNAERD